MTAHTILTPFRMLWRSVIAPFFHALDRGLVQVATLFGALESDRLRRATWMNGLFLGLYAIGVLQVPVLSLAALLFAYIGVLAVGRAWVANEKLRANIVKKLDDTDPDTLPDLRAAALLSALHLLILFPLLLWQLSVQFPGKLFANTEGASFWVWLEFAFEPYSKSLFDQFEAHSHIQDIVASSPGGRFVVLLKRLTLDWIIIQGVMRVFAVRMTIAEAVGALGLHPDITVRLGQRAVGPLTDILKGAQPETSPHLRSQAALVLGQLKATAAAPVLAEALSDPSEEVRWRAAAALGDIRDPQAIPALLQAIRDPDPNTARAALDSLIALEARDVVPTLKQWLGTPGPVAARALAAEGLRHFAGKDAVEPLAAVLSDSDEEVGKSAAAALGMIGDAGAVEPLGKLLADRAASKWVRYEAAKSLEALAVPAAVPPLLAALTDPDPVLRRLAARGLGSLRDPASGAAVIATLRDDAEEVREAAAHALGAIKPADGLEPLVNLLRDSHAEVRDAAAEALVEYGSIAIGAIEKSLPHSDGDFLERLEATLRRVRG